MRHLDYGFNLSALLGDFAHHYDERNAITFTVGRSHNPRWSRVVSEILADDPIAKLSLSVLDFPPKKPRVPSAEALERRQRHKEEKASRKKFLKHELAYANGIKFLDMLEREKARCHGSIGSRQRTMIYVQYNDMHLELGTYEWIMGDSRSYLKFTKVRA